MKAQEVIRAWGTILSGRRPSLSIEITRECPLRCPGCYAYEDSHVAEGVGLRQLQDLKGEALVEGVLRVVDEQRPLHLSIVGGDPLVRFRELDVLLPKLEQRGIHVQLVTSAFREIPRAWAEIPRLNLVVSIDGLESDHDLRRKPATYARILKNISGQLVTVHCTITAQMMQRPQYLDDFLTFWSANPNVKRVWMSFFTPQKGASDPEILSPQERQRAVADLMRLRSVHPKLDMAPAVIREFLHPPNSPDECIFARTTNTISADLKSRIAPCQFGGDPDCSQCGCIASMGLAAVGHHRVAMNVTAGQLFKFSDRIGETVRSFRKNQDRDSGPGDSVDGHRPHDLVTIGERVR
jgi:MoaA/NifB/PqqE/SkfB family radical SAM enzyme